MKVQQIAQMIVIGVAAAAVFLFVRTATDGEARRTCTPLCAVGPHYAARDRTAPNFELPALAGGTKRLADYRGRAVILNFWSKTCPPCLQEMPSIAQLALELKGRSDVSVLTVCTDESLEDARTTLRSVLGSELPPFEVLLDSERKVVTDLFGTKLFPETWFIDPRGVIRARVDGARDWSDPVVSSLLHTLKDPSGCPIEFHRGQARGPMASLCGELK